MAALSPRTASDALASGCGVQNVGISISVFHFGAGCKEGALLPIVPKKPHAPKQPANTDLQDSPESTASRMRS